MSISRFVLLLLLCTPLITALSTIHSTINKCNITLAYPISTIISSSDSSITATTSIFGLINAKEFIEFTCSSTNSLCTTIIPLPSRFAGINSTLVHIYQFTVHILTNTSSLSLLSSYTLPSAHSECTIVPYTKSSTKSTSTGPVRALLYEGWQAYASNATRYIQSINGINLSVEDIIRSNGNLSLYNIWDEYNAGQYTQGFYYQETPTLGYYCIYRKRPNETIGVLPDCLNITGILTQQTAWFNQGSIDFVTADGTNLCTPSPFADAIQTRPFEVLIEEFAALRALGVPTPSVAAWQRSATGCTLWQNILNIYNDPSYEPLIYKDPTTGKKVFFVPDSPDPSIVQQILSNGGRNDIIVQEMWALFDKNTYENGRWAFMSPCIDNSTQGFTTNVVGLQRGATGCGQYMTLNSNLGTAIAVSPSYQLSYGSVPFSAANKYEGLTYKRQFGTIFDNMINMWTSIAIDMETIKLDNEIVKNRLSQGIPQNIYLSSWNEWLSQPQANPFNSPTYAFSMGIPWDTKYRNSLYVDTYGTSISRDTETSVTHGTQLLDIMTSCLRVIQLGTILPHILLPDIYTNTTLLSTTKLHSVVYRLTPSQRLTYLSSLFGRHSHPDQLSSCNVANELCCMYNETTDGYNVVFSLKLKDDSDQLLTIYPDEVANLTCPSCGWTEICNGYGGPTDFCVDQNVLSTAEAMQGPFTLPSSGCGVSEDRIILPNRVPLVRCYDGTHHFISSDPTCGGGNNKMEFSIGCMMTQRDSNTPRELRLCQQTMNNGKYYHMLDSNCTSGDTEKGILGYVH